MSKLRPSIWTNGRRGWLSIRLPFGFRLGHGFRLRRRR